MKRILSQFILMLTCIMYPFYSFAEDEMEVVVDEIIYRCDLASGTAYVYNCDKFAVNVDILSEIEVDGKKFPVTEIGEKAFSYNEEYLKRVTLPSSITKIGDSAFWGCLSLENISIPSSVNAIGNQAFAHCRQLESIILPAAISIIGRWVFNDCENLQSISIPTSVSEIEEYAFEGCKSLTSVSFEGAPTFIGKDAFSNCDNITEVNVNSLYDWLSIEFVNRYSNPTNSSIATLIIGGEKPENIVLPEGLIKIGRYAFANCEQILSVSNTTSITEIGAGAFMGTSIDQINLSQSMVTIENEVFCDCKKLKSIKIPDSVTSIGNLAFAGCSRLTSIDIPNSVTSLGSGVFSSCRSLSSVTLSNSIISIGASAFSYCDVLSSITIPNSVTSLGDEAFYKCCSLKSIQLSDSQTSIGAKTFSECNLLSSISIPNSVTSIGKEAFFGCSLDSITMSNSIQLIGESAFWELRKKPILNIRDVNSWALVKFENQFSNPLNKGGKLLINGQDAKHLVLDVGDKDIVSTAFEGASGQFESIKIKCRNFLSIFANAKNVCIDCDSISHGEFWDVKNLYSLRSTPPAAWNYAFNNYSEINLYVPVGSVDDYKSSEECWWQFSNIYESDFSDIESIFKADYINSDSGVDEIISSNKNNEDLIINNHIYNLLGVCIKANATSEDVKNLKPGLYIIGGKKVLIQ